MQLLFLASILILLPNTLSELEFHYNSSCHRPAAWINDFTIDAFRNTSKSRNVSSFEPILRLWLSGYNDSASAFFHPVLSCGFLSSHESNSAVFVLMLYHASSYYDNLDNRGYPIYMYYGEPQMLWSANRDRPVRANATLDFSRDGNLALRDVDGTVVWSTGTSGRSVVEMKLTERFSLELLDDKNATVWTSEDHPTDTWFVGQTLREGRRLTSSATNFTRSLFYLNVVRSGLQAYIDSNPPQLYYQLRLLSHRLHNFTINFEDPTESTNATFGQGNTLVFAHSNGIGETLNLRTLLLPYKLQFMRLESNGHLRHYGWGEDRWNLLGEVFNSVFSNVTDATPLAECSYPTVCGEYGFCSDDQCSCPDSTNFRQVDQRKSNLGCSLVTPLSCHNTKAHQLLHLADVSYFNYVDLDGAVLRGASEEECKQACLRNCSCKAAFFKFGGDGQNGSCYLPSQLYSIMRNYVDGNGYNSSAYLKVQREGYNSSANYIKVQRGKAPVSIAVIAGIIVGALLFTSLAIGYIIFRMRRKKAFWVEKEENFELVAGLPKRYSFEELRVATENFCQKLGHGGFGSVFEGTLNGERVAVKLLEGLGQGMKEFLAEVRTIGNIHHINLVRLMGFCSEKSSKLLIYEYMCNGSLDKWIFSRNQDAVLDWQTRLQVITDVAKGLTYLHEECRQRIAHLDIKPQNILLDGEFHAKVSDFGLAKLIDRESSHVLTTIRGTRGYLAPEWLSSKITEKADVYSFGVVVMEIVCGRKNLDYSQPEECIHLISMLQNKVQTNQLLDLVGMCNLGVPLPEDEAIEMIKLAMWCLQNDSARRPSMSVVVQVLEGLVNVETDIDYSFTHPIIQNVNQLDASASQAASLLSGPR